MTEPKGVKALSEEEIKKGRQLLRWLQKVS